MQVEAKKQREGTLHISSTQKVYSGETMREGGRRRKAKFLTGSRDFIVGKGNSGIRDTANGLLDRR